MSSLVTKKAPDFTATAVMPDGTFKADFKLSDFSGRYVVLFFYPLDFTFVCPTEILAFNDMIAEFTKRNTQVIGVSVDSHFSHFAWRETEIARGGIGRIEYPLVSDITKKISAEYGVLLEAGVALRGLFLMDKTGTVRHQLVNDLPLGRSIDEALRMVDALQTYEQAGEVCPANFRKGGKTMKPDRNGLEAYFKSH